MNTATRKITSLAFMLLGFIPVLLVLTFSIRQKLIREQMKEKLAHHHLQKIMLPAESVVWMDDDEIWVNDLLFDVHTARVENGVYTFTGLFDDEETSLVHQQEESGKTSNEETNLLEDLLDCIQSPCDALHHPHITLPSGANRFTLYNTLSIIYLLKKVPTPPPRCILHTYFQA